MKPGVDVVFRTTVIIEMQGRVYACRNSLQFFTIPVGLMLSGVMVDNIFEPLMASVHNESLLHTLFGVGKSSGAAFVMLILGLLGAVICLITGRMLKKYHFEDNT